jgi:general stress protein 26
MSESTEHDDQVHKLRELIREIRVAMMTTTEPDGTLRSRPMATIDDPSDSALWFFTKGDSPKVDEVRRERHVNLSYADPAHQKYVSVSGTAMLVRDRKRAEAYWNPLDKAWFPKGLDDPELALLRVDINKAEYWDVPSSTMVHLVGFVKALATGQSYQPGDHARVTP